jgi:hypothetical protein
VNRELIEHATRLLERAAGGTMPADALYARLCSEAGLDVGIEGLLRHVREATDTFVMLPAAAAMVDDSAWSPSDRSTYAAALAAAGLSAAPVIMLAERRSAGSPATGDAARQPAPAEGGDTPLHALLGELHDGLVDLLRAYGDADLRNVVTGAIAGLEDACRQEGTPS